MPATKSVAMAATRPTTGVLVTSNRIAIRTQAAMQPRSSRVVASRGTPRSRARRPPIETQTRMDAQRTNAAPGTIAASGAPAARLGGVAEPVVAVHTDQLTHDG